jgi:protein-tyrosine phosphatase
MGIHGLNHEPASAHARQACDEHGVDISGHRSRPITGEDLQQADLILCMEPGHQRFMKTFFPWHRNRVFLLGAWPGKKTRKSIVKDPIGAPIEVYRIVYNIIDGHIDRIWGHL